MVLINGVIPAQEQTKKDYKREDEADVTCSGYDTSKEKDRDKKQAVKELPERWFLFIINGVLVLVVGADVILQQLLLVHDV